MSRIASRGVIFFSMGESFGERYQPAMRTAGATRAQARGVRDDRIGSDGWFGEIILLPLIAFHVPIGSWQLFERVALGAEIRDQSIIGNIVYA